MSRRRSFQGVAGLALREVDFLKALVKGYRATGRWNMKAAAIACGYSPAHAHTEGSRILARPHVQAAWEAFLHRRDLLAEIEPETIDARHVLDLEAIAHSNILDISDLVAEPADAGGALRYRLRPSEQWPLHAARAVKKIKQKETIRTLDAETGATETTIELEVELHDKLGALRLEAQERGLIKSGKATLPDGTELESLGEGGIHIYQMNRFDLPDNGRGPVSDPIPVVGAATTG
jgi:phage terminase small subunit